MTDPTSTDQADSRAKLDRCFDLIREAFVLQRQAGYTLGRSINPDASAEAIARAEAEGRKADAAVGAAWRALYDAVSK